MPETTDGKKFDYTKLGMMKAHMHQQRLDKNKKKMGAKVGSLAIAGTGAAVFAGHQYEIQKYNKMKMDIVNRLGMQMHKGEYKFPSQIPKAPPAKGSVPRVITSTPMFVDGKTESLRPHHPKVKQFQANLKKTRTINSINNFRAKKMSGGGGGGIYNVAQPVADKNIMNKYGKKLK